MVGDEGASSTLAVLVGAMVVGAIGAVVIAQYKAYNLKPEVEEIPLESTSREDECGSTRGEDEREADLPTAPSDRSAVNEHGAPPCRLR